MTFPLRAARIEELETALQSLSQSKEASKSKKDASSALDSKTSRTPLELPRGFEEGHRLTEKLTREVNGSPKDASNKEKTTSAAIKKEPATNDLLSKAVGASSQEGKVVAINTTWNFVVVSMGSQDGIVVGVEVSIKRNDQVIAKAKVTSVEALTSVADLVTSSLVADKTVEVGDQVSVSEKGTGKSSLLSTLQPLSLSTVLMERLPVRFVLSIMLLLLMVTVLTSCESLGNSSENNASASASAIPWNKPASWEGAGALGGMGFQGTH